MSEEINFIHDVSGSVGTLLVLIEPALEGLKSKGQATAEEQEQLESALQVLENLRTLIQTRRQRLREQAGSK